jgi:hypothetical protein
VASDSEHAVGVETGVVSLFGHTWQDMPGDTPIADQYVLEPGVFGADDSYQVFTESAMDAFDRLQARRHEARFASVLDWAGRGFNRRDGESTT